MLATVYCSRETFYREMGEKSGEWDEGARTENPRHISRPHQIFDHYVSGER